MKLGKPHFLVVSTNFLSGYFINTWWHYVTITKRHWHAIMALELSNVLMDILVHSNKTACNKRHFCWDFLTNQEVY